MDLRRVQGFGRFDIFYGNSNIIHRKIIGSSAHSHPAGAGFFAPHGICFVLASSLSQVFHTDGVANIHDEGFAFWRAYFSRLPWYNGWHIHVGHELGRRIRSHPSHDEWADRAFHWAQESVRRELRPEETEWMRWLRRQDCNYTRYSREKELLMTQWGDCALQLAVSSMIPKAEAVGFKVRHHCREATTNQNLCRMWNHLGMNLERFGTQRTSDVIEMYLLQMMESAVGENIFAAENLIFVGAYALLLQYCPWNAPSRIHPI